MLIQILKLEKIARQIEDWLFDVERIEEQNARNIKNIKNRALKLKLEISRLKEMYTKEEGCEGKNEGNKACK